MKASFKIVGRRPKYITRVTVGVQTFDFGREYETKKEARWYIKMFKNALANLDPTIPEPEP